MTSAIIVSIIIFLILLGGLIPLLKNKDFPLPKDYDPKKNPGYDDDDETGY